MVSGRDFLGPYRMVRLIRAGQQTQVWEVLKDGESERRAMKVLMREYLKNREEITRLKHEAKVGIPLKHKNIINIHEFNFEHEMPFLVMELFHARNLKQDLREQNDRVAHLVTEIITQAAEALRYIHTKGWVHCDIKPDNFLVSDQGDLRLIDFSIAQKPKKGLAALFGRGGVTKGTRSYMSPEQIRRQSLDGRSDIYSLGCVIFEILGGRAPYTASNPNELLAKHLKASIPTLAPMNDAITPEVIALVQKMMAKDRNSRPKDMDEFLKTFRALRVYKTGMKPRAPDDLASDEEGE